MEITVWATVCVAVVVDTEEGTVDRVVLDEDVKLLDDQPTINGNPAPAEEAAKAIAIFNNPEIDWPTWEHGW